MEMIGEITVHEVIINGKTYHITYCLHGSEVSTSSTGRTVLVGEVDTWDKTIRVLDRGNKTDILHTLLHEAIHAMVDEMSLTALSLPSQEDELDRLSGGIVDVLTRNQWLGCPWVTVGTPEVDRPNVAGRRYTVVWVGSVEDVDDIEGDVLVSFSSPTLKTIRLHKSVDKYNRIFTLIRESMRLLTFELRMGVWEDKEHERALLCNALTDLLLRNEWLAYDEMERRLP